MGDKQNLSNQDAVKKMKDLAEEVKICMFCTYDAQQVMQTAPMSANQIDDDGTFWFLSAKDSTRNRDIQANSTTDLIFAQPSKENYLSVHGKSEIVYDKQKIADLWNPIVKTWFTGGKDDPNISIIKFTPDEAYYWDTKHGKMVSFLKIVAGAVLGKTMDDGIQGKLKV
ncbi:general stress protein [Ilyomonas limi]|uniref:General stress protein n=1 Tax=Ilyomonas limi TaxID=2575867 RepID=A0A4U3KWF3_9BACT|nr:pyridoxamine 5'-phosphate oxidase family protein [Ilyomonas limi]TKK65984.1 general stress protein [Ilyomonas limi]